MDIAHKMNVVLDGNETKAIIIKKITDLQEKESVLDEGSEVVVVDDIIQLNNYYVGDNLEIMKRIDDSSVDLIYFDPPYNTGRHFYDFDDKFTSINDYIEFITKRVVECKRIMKDTGTIVIHM